MIKKTYVFSGIGSGVIELDCDCGHCDAACGSLMWCCIETANDSNYGFWEHFFDGAGAK